MVHDSYFGLFSYISSRAVGWLNQRIAAVKKRAELNEWHIGTGCYINSDFWMTESLFHCYNFISIFALFFKANFGFNCFLFLFFFASIFFFFIFFQGKKCGADNELIGTKGYFSLD